MENFRVMILEDDHNRIRHFKSILELQVQDVSYHLTAESFIEQLENETKIDLMLLDHDLGDRVYVDTKDKNTGSEVARYIVMNKDQEKFKSTKFIVHSFNGPAARFMVDILRQAGFQAAYAPGVWQKEVFRKFIELEA
jgi:CheY-like chemotaxis protein